MKNKFTVTISYPGLLIFAFFLYPVYTDLLMILLPSQITVILGNSLILFFLVLHVYRCGIKKDIILLYLITFFLFLIYIFKDDSYFLLYSDSQWGFLSIYGLHTGIFGYTLIRSVEDLSHYENIIKKICFILMIYYSIQCLEPLINTYWIIDGEKMVYNMSFGYSIQLPIIFMIYFYLKEKNYLYLIFIILGLVEIILFGSRGPLIGILIYSIIQFILYKEKNKFLRVLISFIALVIILFVFTDVELLQNIIDFLSERGIVSRTLSKFANSAAVDDNGRNLVRQEIYKLFYENTIIVGYGPLGDFVLTGHYSHNIILEVVVTFGLILGPILIISFLLMLIYAYLKSKKSVINNYIIMFFCLSIPKLFISSSFWRESCFWILTGLLVNVITKKVNDTIKIS